MEGEGERKEGRQGHRDRRNRGGKREGEKTEGSTTETTEREYTIRRRRSGSTAPIGRASALDELRRARGEVLMQEPRYLTANLRTLFSA